MFRCTDCNAEYKIKPDYCDCGNNTFEEISQPAYIAKTANIQAGQILSIIIFIFCLILAIIPWTIPDKKQSSEHKNIKLEKPQTEIPDIEKIWNNTPLKQEPAITYEKPKPIPEPQAVKVIQNNPPAIPEPQAVKVIQNNPPAMSKEKPKTTKPTTQTSSKQGQNLKPTVQKPQKIEQPKQTPVTAPQKTVKETAPLIPPKPVMNKTEFENYKNALRLSLLSKLDLVKVTGSGDCAVQFSVSESGKLVNRGFLYQSNNKSVNDQVYLMLMRLPSYKTPPKGYNGEVIKLKFYINNGYYEISFID